MKPNPILIQDVMRNVVAKVNTALLARLQAYDSAITAVHFEFGTGLEIIETLQQLTDIDPFSKYPLVALFLDVDETMSNEIGIYSEIPKLRMAIVTGTEQTYKAAQRDEVTFKPILIPIYQELVYQMGLSCAFMTPYEGLEHDMTRNYYWGRNGLYGKDGNIFNDKCDAIEITFRDLKILETYCPDECGAILTNI